MYVLDSNTFIDAKNRYYGFDIVPSFWNKLIENSPENILTIKPIEDEIMAGHDELSSWFQDNYTVHAYASDSAEIQQVFARISNYVAENTQYKDSEKAHFLSKADPWIIAYAYVNNCVVVTHEILAPGSKKVKLPDICNFLHVQYINVFEMLRELHIQI